MKLNAFGGPVGRRHPKDAYDILLAVTAFNEGPEKAIQLFQAEREQGNPAFEDAMRTLERDFVEKDADGPIRAAKFLSGTDEQSERIREDMVTVGRALFG